MNKKQKKDINKLIIICLVLVTLTMTIAYSSLSTSLSISGEVAFDPEKADGINLSELVCTSQSNPNGIINYYNNNGLSIALGIELPDLESTVTCRAKVNNTNDHMVKLKSVNNTNHDNNGIIFDLSELYINDIINANSNRYITITFKYKNSLTSLTTNSFLESTLLFNFASIEDDGITKDGLIFYITGKDDKNSAGMWPDRINGTNVTLFGDVERTTSNNSYIFSGSGTCGYTNASLIPHEQPIGTNPYGYAKNFTIETRIIPSNFSADEAIISQKRLISISSANEVGRFKPFNINAGFRYFWQYTDKSQSLNKYYSKTTSSGLPMYMTLTYQITDESTHTGIVTRYLNGVAVETPEELVGAVISDFTTQIGCWNDYNNSQNYIGSINMVRIYDKVLTPEEVNNNYSLDSIEYSKTYEEKDLKKLALLLPATADGSKLTADQHYEPQNGIARYVYKGINPNNYIVLSNDKIYDENNDLIESEQIWRIMSFESDGTMKLIKPVLYPMAFDKTGERNLTENPYCIHTEDYAETLNGERLTKGCNAFAPSISYGALFPDTSNFNTLYSGTINNPAVSQASTMSKKLNNLGTGTYYTPGEISAINASATSSWRIGPCSIGSIPLLQTLDETEEYVWNGKVGSINMYDVRISNLSEQTNTSSSMNTSYIAKLATANKDIWTINSMKDNEKKNTWDVIAIVSTTLASRRASRESQGSVIFYAFPVIRVNSHVDVAGDGSESNPYRFLEN